MHMSGRSEEVSPIRDAITLRKGSMRRVERANADFTLDDTPPELDQSPNGQELVSDVLLV